MERNRRPSVMCSGRILRSVLVVSVILALDCPARTLRPFRHREPPSRDPVLVEPKLRALEIVHGGLSHRDGRQTDTKETVENAYRIGREALLKILARGSFPDWKRLTLAAE